MRKKLINCDYPYYQTPFILQPLIDKQLIASKPLIDKPRRKRKKVAPSSKWVLPFGAMGALIIYYLFSLDWDMGALMLFLGAVSSALLSAFFLMRYFKKNRESLPSTPPSQTRAKILNAKNKLRKRYLSRPLKDKVKKLLKRKVLALESISPSATVGVSEKQFLAVLQQYFGQKVNFPTGVFSIPCTEFEYTPDMVYQDSYTGLTIDIEIDEPYAGNSKEPHHCTVDDKDKNRDEFFLQRNWVVVRFAEEQVVKNPLGCAYYLDRLIKSLSGITHNVPPTELEPITMWDSSSARQMASKQHREIYLEQYGLFTQRD